MFQKYFELSNAVDNMKFINRRNSHQFDNNCTITAMTALRDAQTGQNAIFAVTRHLKDHILNQITEPSEESFSKFWTSPKTMLFRRQYLLPNSCEMTRIKAG